MGTKSGAPQDNDSSASIDQVASSVCLKDPSTKSRWSGRDVIGRLVAFIDNLQIKAGE